MTVLCIMYSADVYTHFCARFCDFQKSEIMSSYHSNDIIAYIADINTYITWYRVIDVCSNSL